MKSYEKFKVFGFMSKFKFMFPLAKRHKIMNVRKGVLALQKGQTYLPQACSRDFFYKLLMSSHYALPSGSRAHLHSEARRAELPTIHNI